DITCSRLERICFYDVAVRPAILKFCCGLVEGESVNAAGTPSETWTRLDKMAGTLPVRPASDQRIRFLKRKDLAAGFTQLALNSGLPADPVYASRCSACGE